MADEYKETRRADNGTGNNRLVAEPDFYHAGNRRFQDDFGSRRLADRLETVTVHREFTDEDRMFIEGAAFFFLATADPQGRPDCSFKGGLPGFVRVTGPDELTFPDYDGNGMFRSLGNIALNPAVGLLFIAMDGNARRIRVNGLASVVDDEGALSEFTGAQLLVRVRAQAIFPNCPRYIPDPNGAIPYAPRSGVTPPEPAWKHYDVFRDVVPQRAATPSSGPKPEGSNRQKPTDEGDVQ